MDRLGDHLTELMLSYLRFSDKVRLECVSKQWRRLIYNKQFVIEIEENRFDRKETLNRLFKQIDNIKQLDMKSFESVLRKCPNITKSFLTIEIDGPILSLIGQYCPRLKSLHYYPKQSYKDSDSEEEIDSEKDIDSEEDINSEEINCFTRKFLQVSSPIDGQAMAFFRQYGHKLEELVIYYDNDIEIKDLKKILQLCPNLKKVNDIDEEIIIKEMSNNENFLSKLKRIETRISSNNVYKMTLLADKYSKTMNELGVGLLCLTATKLKTSVDLICRFDNLRDLRLQIELKKKQSIEQYLSLIGKNCPKILGLGLYLNSENYSSISGRLFAPLSEFRAIKNLKITFDQCCTDSDESVESLKHCAQLTHLDFNMQDLTESFFANIESFVPKLQTLRIKTENEFSDSFIDKFKSMKSIQLVHLYVKEDDMPLASRIWYFGKRLYEVMSSPNENEVIRVDNNCGFIDSEDYY